MNQILRYLAELPVVLMLGMFIGSSARLNSFELGRKESFGRILRPWLTLRGRLHRENSDGHVVGYKWAYLITLKNTGVAFHPVRNHPIYHVESIAECGHGRIGDSDRCKCGFYALKYRQHLGYVTGSLPWRGRKTPSGFPVILEVDLSGRLIEGSVGYRAEKQRILKVMVPQYCWMCYQRKLRKSKLVKAVALLKINGRSYVPVCSNCAPEYHISLATMADQLKTEVVWDQKRPVV